MDLTSNATSSSSRSSRPVVVDEEKNLIQSLGLDDILQHENVYDASSADGKIAVHPALAAGLGAAFLLNVGVILSLPPALRGRGAPYLPTFGRGLDAMFREIRRQPTFAKKISSGAFSSSSSQTPLPRFVDLGSGDGRVVFRAAREGIFGKCIGYEINPLLHAWASFRRLAQAPTYWSVTRFALGDLWKVDLGDVDVVAVYGLQPIMEDLGKKMKAELKPGALVVSNVFRIPGWVPNVSSSEGIHLYQVPDCWGGRGKEATKISTTEMKTS